MRPGCKVHAPRKLRRRLQVSALRAEVAELEDRLAERDAEVERLRADLEGALREEIADSDPARLRQAQQRVADLDADLAAKQVTSPPPPITHLNLPTCPAQVTM